MDLNKNDAFDQEGFEAFFKTHPNDATVEEVPTESDNTDNNNNSQSDEGTDSNTNDNLPNGSGANTADDGADDNTADDNDANNQQALDADVKAQQQAHAFAAMRTANKQQQQLLNQIAQVVGITDTKDQDAMLKALQGLVIKAQSQKQGIPEEVLARLNVLEETNIEYQKQQAYLAAGRGFQSIKDTFKVDDAGLEAFARELIRDGINPYETPIDLMAEYKNRHFDDLIEQAVQRGIEQEAKRAAKAGAQSSTPNQTSGGTDDSADTKIDSVASLNKWLDENKNKLV
jgi:hypothetical protein